MSLFRAASRFFSADGAFATLTLTAFTFAGPAAVYVWASGRPSVAERPYARPDWGEIAERRDAEDAEMYARIDADPTLSPKEKRMHIKAIASSRALI